MAKDTHGGKSKKTGRSAWFTEQRYVVVGITVALAFFGSYAYASSVNSSSSPDGNSVGTGGPAGSSAVGPAQAGGAGGAAGGGSCCGSGGAPGGAAPGGAAPGGAAPGGAAPGGAAPGGAGGGGGCCGGGGSGKTVKGKAKLEGNVQTIAIDTSSGGYSPNEITLKAGVPAEIAFSPSSGCLAGVIFPDTNVQADLSQGATIKLPAMQPGEYQWYCGMQMVFGKLIVK